MIQRYTHPEMGAIWSDEKKYQTWLDVELAATDALADLLLTPSRDADAEELRREIDAAAREGAA